MKSFKFSIHGNEYNVSILNVEENIVDVEVNGTLYKVEVEKSIATTKTPKIVRPTAIPSTDTPKGSEKTQSTSTKPSQGYKVLSPLPGVILEIMVKPGDIVTVGQRLLLLEAMKMENHIDADKTGKITSINIAKGDNVMQGDVLLIIGE